MPKFKSEQDKQAWQEKCRATREAKKVKAETVQRTGGIAGAIEEIDSKIAALENVKRQLLHAQELVKL